MSTAMLSRTARVQTPQWDTAAIMGGLYGDGIIGLKGAFERSWVQQMGEDIQLLFEDALTRPEGAVGRGPKRYYVEVHPEGIHGFLDLVIHPWVVAVSEAVLGPDYKIVEIGFDVPGPGAAYQPWHRDFPAPPETSIGRRLNSLAFNLTAVDVFEDMGPFEIAPGTQWDEPEGFQHGMFPAKSLYQRYENAQDAEDGRHLRPLRSHHSPGHAQPVRQVASGAGSGGGRPGRPPRYVVTYPLIR